MPQANIAVLNSRLGVPAQPVDATLFYSVDPIVFFKET
jgi:hypothetical protein